MLLLKDILAMSAPLRLITIATISGLLFAQQSTAQTYTSCNPTQQQCPSDPALGRSISADFTAGASNEFTEQGNPTYGSEGVSFTVSAGGDAPQLQSNWYIMFGKYEITVKAAPGAGIVSSVVLQSNDLDEIDWEWLGAQNDEVQTNYFGKGQTTSYDRATVVNVENTQAEWHTYGVEWTEEQIVWQVDGATVRVLKASDANGQYPQTPCQLRFGSWSGGDPSNPEGTISWAEGPTDYSDGPFTMVVSSVSVVDYSTGSSYTYGDRSGSWSSIESDGGRVNGNVGGSVGDAPSPSVTSAPGSSIVPVWATPSGSQTLTYTTYPGLPSGWSVNPTSGKVIPPSSAAPSASRSASSASSPAVSPAAHCSASGFKTVTAYNQRGFLTTEKIPIGVSTGWDNRGFPTTIYPHGCEETGAPKPKAHLAEAVARKLDAKDSRPMTTSLPQASAVAEKVDTARKTEQNDAASGTARWSAVVGTLLAATGFAVFLA